MGFIVSRTKFNAIFKKLHDEYDIYAPALFEQGANFSDLNLVRYGRITNIDDIVFDIKSANSCKEALHPASQTLFYFTENEMTESKAPVKKLLVFLRSCDIHGLKRLDDILIENGSADYFYERIKTHARFVLMPCKESFENCFCVDMETNQTDEYDFSVEKDGDDYRVHCKAEDFSKLFSDAGAQKNDTAAPFVKETKTQVTISGKITNAAATLPLWEEYDSRCINCGRCTFSCPSCSCWTMQDMFYTDNGKAGERRRVWASCMVDGYADVAGGGTYRKKNGERMRFKVLHKIYDHKKQFGHTMCTGCGRCDDVCPEYISFSNIINKLNTALETAAQGGAS